MRKLSEFLLRRKADQPTGPQSEDYHAHMYLGNMYLSLGDLTQAEAEYSRAHALSPSEESRTALGAIQKRRTEQCYSADKCVATARAA
jgi:tetratricopeptide (TPR) repeat protein